MFAAGSYPQTEGTAMPGLGTLINMALIVAGGLVGLVCGRFVDERMQDALMKAAGVSVMFIGIGGAVEQMLAVHGASVTNGGTATIVVSLAVGTVAGELLGIEGWFERLGTWLKRVTGNAQDRSFVNGFVTASLTVSIGAMAIVGSIQDGVEGDWTVLALKGAVDAIIICVMAASMGPGCLFSAIPVGVFEGAVTLLARAVEPLLTQQALANLSMVGSILIFCIGVNLIRENTFRAANMLPAVLVAVTCAFV